MRAVYVQGRYKAISAPMIYGHKDHGAQNPSVHLNFSSIVHIVECTLYHSAHCTIVSQHCRVHIVPQCHSLVVCTNCHRDIVFYTAYRPHSAIALQYAQIAIGAQYCILYSVPQCHSIEECTQYHSAIALKSAHCTITPNAGYKVTDRRARKHSQSAISPGLENTVQCFTQYILYAFQCRIRIS